MSKEWVDRVLNSKSKSFCGAKWYNATIWLGSGSTASCHHPPSHRIDKNELKNNPSALHNTKYKKIIRRYMQEGIKPKECEYCWKIEDLGNEYVSDRCFKSQLNTKKELDTAFNLQWENELLDVAFDIQRSYL